MQPLGGAITAEANFRPLGKLSPAPRHWVKSAAEASGRGPLFAPRRRRVPPSRDRAAPRRNTRSQRDRSANSSDPPSASASLALYTSRAYRDKRPFVTG